MSVEIEKYKTRIAIRAPYEERLNDVIRQQDKRYWDSERCEWTVPIGAIDELTKKFQELGYKVNIKENNPIASINRNGDLVQVRFNKYITSFSKFRSIKDSVYDSETKTFSIPATEQQTLLDYLIESNIQFVILPAKETTPSPPTQQEQSAEIQTTPPVSIEIQDKLKNAINRRRKLAPL